MAVNCTYIIGSLTISQLLQAMVPSHTDSENSQTKVEVFPSCTPSVSKDSHTRGSEGFQFVVILVRDSLIAMLLEMPQAGCIPAPLFQ